MIVQPDWSALSDYAAHAADDASVLHDLADQIIVAAEGGDICQIAHIQRLAGRLRSAVTNIDTALSSRELPRPVAERTDDPANPTTNPCMHIQLSRDSSTPAACTNEPAGEMRDLLEAIAATTARLTAAHPDHDTAMRVTAITDAVSRVGDLIVTITGDGAPRSICRPPSPDRAALADAAHAAVIAFAAYSGRCVPRVLTDQARVAEIVSTLIADLLQFADAAQASTPVQILDHALWHYQADNAAPTTPHGARAPYRDQPAVPDPQQRRER